MKEQTKKLRLNKKTEHMKGEAAYRVLAEARALERQGKRIIHLEIGEPDFDTPAHIKEAGTRAIQEGKTKYTPTHGLHELREAIAEYVSKTRGVKIIPQMVSVLPSAKMAIFTALTAILEQEDEMIYPNPGFPTYENVGEYVGAALKPVPLLEEKYFSFDLEEFEKNISERTKLIIINSPSNPTGGIVPNKDLEHIAKLARQFDAWVLTDEIYAQMVYDKPHASIMSVPGMRERTILVDGFSKTFAMTGWRLGYIVAPEEITAKLENFMVNSFACTAEFVQYAGIEALRGPREPVENMVREFKKRRDLIVPKLNSIPGMRCHMPQGAFYLFPNIKALGKTSEEVARYILGEAGVAVLPGTAFGKYGEGYLRISYATSLGLLEEAIERIKKAIEKIK